MGARDGKFHEVDQPRGDSPLDRQFEIYPSFPSLYMAAHALRTAAADTAQGRMQQVSLQSANDSAIGSGSNSIVQPTDPILDDMAASIAYSGDELHIEEWDPSKEECKSPS